MALVSCENEDQKPTMTDEELIGSGVAWKISSATASGINIMSLIEECLLDNLITLNYNASGNTGILYAGKEKCSASEPQTTDFTWTYNEATAILSFNSNVIDLPGAEGQIEVLSISKSELIITQNIKLSGIQQDVVLTFRH